jgi:hypothetical protein
LRLNELRVERKFLITVNILNNFINAHADIKLFGHNIAHTRLHRYNISNVDNILDICLFTDVAINQSYLVISGNLTEAFRRNIGNNIINQIRINLTPHETGLYNPDKLPTKRSRHDVTHTEFMERTETVNPV